jgi:anti-sigma regulatory factor (Ser/Thr protein kinase)
MTDAEQLLDKTFVLADLPVIRAFLRDCAIAAGMAADRREEFILAVHELLANAVEHGGGGGQVLVWQVNGELRCRVRDQGPGLVNGWRQGSGLRIVRALADRFEIGCTDHGSDITMTMMIRPAVPGRAPGPAGPC